MKLLNEICVKNSEKTDGLNELLNPYDLTCDIRTKDNHLYH